MQVAKVKEQGTSTNDVLTSELLLASRFHYGYMSVP